MKYVLKALLKHNKRKGVGDSLQIEGSMAKTFQDNTFCDSITCNVKGVPQNEFRSILSMLQFHNHGRGSTLLLLYIYNLNLFFSSQPLKKVIKVLGRGVPKRLKIKKQKKKQETPVIKGPRRSILNLFVRINYKHLHHKI